mmetsp:Transcript_123271/g.343208  ORF Transcript_123271/g.343208 Transcript_123271/m.343208 type:complete len:298 (-) Transcript_123271:1141-2034(-)
MPATFRLWRARACKLRVRCAGRPCKASRSLGFVVALHPFGQALEGMVGCPLVGAIWPNANPDTELVSLHFPVPDALDTDLGQAVPHPPVLAPLEIAMALDRTTRIVLNQACLGDGLNGAKHHGSLLDERRGVAVLDVRFDAGVGQQVLAELVGNQNGIRVDLHGPVRKCVLAAMLHSSPDVDEQLRVAGGTVNANTHRCRLEAVGPDRSAGPVPDPALAVAGQDVGHVAAEDADAAIGADLLPQDGGLVGAQSDDRVAVERGFAPGPGRADAEAGATPSTTVLVILVDARGTPAQAA